MFTIGGSTGIILGNAAVDLGLHDTYYDFKAAIFFHILEGPANGIIFLFLGHYHDGTVFLLTLFPSLSQTLPWPTDPIFQQKILSLR